MDNFIDIEGYNGFYQINSIGVVRSLGRTWKCGVHNSSIRIKYGSIVPQSYDKIGYKKISLTDNKSVNKKHFVHRLIALHFIPNPENKPQVNHKNGVKSDNRIENLEWVTPKENVTHAHKTGLASTEAAIKKTSKPVFDTLTEIIYPSCEKASLANNISRRHLLNMLYGKYKNSTNLVFV